MPRSVLQGGCRSVSSRLPGSATGGSQPICKVPVSPAPNDDPVDHTRAPWQRLVGAWSTDVDEDLEAFTQYGSPAHLRLARRIGAVSAGVLALYIVMIAVVTP